MNHTPLTDLLTILAFFISIFGSVKLLDKSKINLQKGQVSQDDLTGDEKTQVWILAFLNPIWTFIILYYGWRKQLPVKAKGVNSAAILAFLVWVILLNI